MSEDNHSIVPLGEIIPEGEHPPILWAALGLRLEQGSMVSEKTDRKAEVCTVGNFYGTSVGEEQNCQQQHWPKSQVQCPLGTYSRTCCGYQN